MRPTEPMRGRVWLVGAGPGDPGLLTLAGARALTEANVVLYDALVSQGVLDLVPAACERIFVGKRGGDHALPQEEIEATMVRQAREGKRVVRLKGGDPFVFGRGGEEAEALQQAGIAFEIVPGVTSAIAAPAYAGIPVTHRAYNTAFTVATGHEDPSKSQSTIDWKLLANPHQTLVLLMAAGNLRAIAARLIEEGLPGSRLIALIANATLPSQITITGTLSTIVELAANADLPSPAIAVVGEAVALREKLSWFEASPLFGKRILITRPLAQSSSFARALQAAGAQAVVAPTIRIEAPSDIAAAEWATRDPSAYAWIVFTSANGVRSFFMHLDARRDDARIFGRSKIAAIGPVTAAALRERGVYPDLLPQRYVAEDLAQALTIASAPGDRILLYRAAEARDVLPDRLRTAGREVDVVEGYRVELVDDPTLVEKLEQCNVVTFTSPSTVRGFAQNLQGREPDLLTRGKFIACIGPITAQEARDAGLHVDCVAQEFTAAGLIAALQRETVAR